MHWALFSGGHDSLVATHRAMENGSTEKVLHLDTGTGIDENLDFVRSVCEEYGWPLRIEETSEDYVELVKEYGFPGPSVHQWFYSYLKERQLRQIARESDEMPHFWTGVRKLESDRRMKAIETGITYEDRWVWINPIAGFSDQHVNEYIDEHDLPENPVVDSIHRSGECFCGAYAARDEELLMLQAEYPEHYEWLLEVEQEVIEERGKEETSFWGHGGESSCALQALAEDYDDVDEKLCESCTGDMHDTTDW